MCVVAGVRTNALGKINSSLMACDLYTVCTHICVVFCCCVGCCCCCLRLRACVVPIPNVRIWAEGRRLHFKLYLDSMGRGACVYVCKFQYGTSGQFNMTYVVLHMRRVLQKPCTFYWSCTCDNTFMYYNALLLSYNHICCTKWNIFCSNQIILYPALESST